MPLHLIFLPSLPFLLLYNLAFPDYRFAQATKKSPKAVILVPIAKSTTERSLYRLDTHISTPI